MPHAKKAIPACRRVRWRWTHLLAVTVLHCSTAASEPLPPKPANLPLADFDHVSKTDSNKGVGIGQLACGDFSKSADRLASGLDDGLYHAFLAWRDGFVTASADHALRVILTSAKADRWLSIYCRNHPDARFAHAVVAAVRQLSGIRTAQLAQR